jgi:diadenosine tetraphosphate (Ap4A) HIT family hydrolase
MNFLISKDEYYFTEQCYSCAVPGYLIVSPALEVTSINELPLAVQMQLGPTLASAAEIITDIVKPIKIYCTQYGEEDTRLHFHVFPRTNEITASFLEDFPEKKDLIHGPILFDWARSKYRRSRKEVWSVVEPVVVEMQIHNNALQSDAAKPRR